MNILDDNSENVLLQKTPFGKILLFGIVVPIGMTFLIFYYLFDVYISSDPFAVKIRNYVVPVTEISILVLIFSTLLILNMTSTWVRNVNCPKMVKLTLLILVLFLTIISTGIAIYGELIEPSWTINYRFRYLMYFISLVGIFSLWDISKHYFKK